MSWYVVFFIVYVVTYEEFPTPFAGFTHSFTYSMGHNFELYHWLVWLGGAILLFGFNAVFFGVYWMMIVGYQMLKRDVGAVIEMSKGDTQFKTVNSQQFTPEFNIITNENKEISKFLREMENSGKETTRSEALNS